MTETPVPRLRRRSIRRAGRALAWVVLGLTLAGTMGWAALAISYGSLNGGPPRWIVATLFVAASVATLALPRRRLYRFGGYGTLLALVVTWYFCLAPSNDRDWELEMARLASVEIDGSRATIRNVRNFHFRTRTDYDPAWEERTYDLDRLTSVDLILSYWGSRAVAHTMISFGFDDGRHLAISIEARRVKGEPYSVVPALFRGYELIYIVADERDALRLRTNVRGEEVYLYQLRESRESIRAAFLSYLKRINSLRDHPEWYNMLTANCTNSILPHARDAGNKASLTWEVVLCGYAARPAYRNGKLDTSLSFGELERRSLINAAAIAADDRPDFSARIRKGLPTPHD